MAKQPRRERDFCYRIKIPGASSGAFQKWRQDYQSCEAWAKLLPKRGADGHASSQAGASSGVLEVGIKPLPLCRSIGA